MATLEQIGQALKAADAAGNTEDARKLAQAYAQMRDQQQPKADFSGVSSSAQSVSRPPPVMSLEQVNAANRAAVAAPGFREREQSGQLARRQQAFQAAPAPVRAMAGAGGRVVSVGRGFEQLGAAAMDAVAPRQNTLSSLITGQPKSRYDEAMAKEAKAREHDRFMEGDTAASLGGVAADIGMLWAPVSKVGQLPRAGQYMANAGIGAAYAGAQPVVEGESRGINAAVGGALGLAGQGASDAVMTVGKRAASAITPELRQLAQRAQERGIPFTGADVAQSEFVRRIASLTDALPLSGASGRQAARTDALGKELARSIGQNADELNQSTMAQAYADLGRQYDTFFADGMTVDRQLIEGVKGIRQFADENLDETARRSAASFVDRLEAQLKDGGRISGETLQSLDQQARKLATGGGDRQQVMQELRGMLHEAFGRQGGKGDEWRRLNQQYANYKTLEPLLARNPNGVAPEQLLQAMNSTKAGKARMARGQGGDLGELARIGQQMRPPRTSKTPEGLLSLIMGGGAVAAPTVAIPAALAANLGGRALNSQLAARFFLREGRGQGAQAVAPYLRPAAVPMAYPQDPEDPRNRP